MLKNISNLGTTLDNSEQKAINGGNQSCNGRTCKLMTGFPYGAFVTYEQYMGLEPQFRCCVRVAPFGV